MYPDAHVGDIWRVDNSKAESQVKSDKAPMGPLQSRQYQCAGLIRL
jgi:hypothetical protein